MRAPTWLTAPLLASMFFGGLAVFTWFENRQPAVTANYVVSTEMNPQERPLRYKNLIALDRTSGYADRIEVTVAFPGPVNVSNIWLHAPDAHVLTCETIRTGITCRLGPMDANGQYRLALVTDSGVLPVLTASSSGVQLLSPQDIASREVASNLIFIFTLTAVLLLALSWVVASRPAPIAWVLGQDDFKV